MIKGVPVEAASKIFYMDTPEDFNGYCDSVIAPEENNRLNFLTALLLHTTEILQNSNTKYISYLENEISREETKYIVCEEQIKKLESDKQECEKKLKIAETELNDKKKQFEETEQENEKLKNQFKDNESKLRAAVSQSDKLPSAENDKETEEMVQYYRCAFYRLQSQYNASCRLCSRLRERVQRIENDFQNNLQNLAATLYNSKNYIENSDTADECNKKESCSKNNNDKLSDMVSQSENVVLKDNPDNVSEEINEELRATVLQSKKNEKATINQIRDILSKNENLMDLQTFIEAVEVLKKQKMA